MRRIICFFALFLSVCYTLQAAVPGAEAMKVAVNYFNAQAQIKPIAQSDKKYSVPVEPLYSEKKYLTGYADDKGKYIIKPMFENADTFDKQGLAFVKYNGYWGIIDRTGAFCIAPIFSSRSRTSVSGVFAFKVCRVLWEEYTGRQYAKDRKAVLEAADVHDMIRIYMRADGSVLNDIELIEGGDFDQNGVAIVQTSEGYGLMRRDGSMASQPRHEALVNYGRSGNFKFTKGLFNYGILDSNGNELLPADYSAIDDWHRDNLIWVQQASTGKWGAMDKDCNIVIATQLDEKPELLERYGTAVVSQGGKYGVLRGDGTYLRACIDDYVMASEGCFWVGREGNVGVVYNEEGIQKHLQLPNLDTPSATTAGGVVATKMQYGDTFRSMSWVDGLSDFTVYQAQRDPNGTQLLFDYCGTPYVLRLAWSVDTLATPQTEGVALSIRPMSEATWQSLPVDKKTGMVGDEELRTNEYEIGTVDFDRDGKPELVMMMRNNEQSCPAESVGTCYNIYKLKESTGQWLKYRGSRLTQDRARRVTINGNSFKPVL